MGRRMRVPICPWNLGKEHMCKLLFHLSLVFTGCNYYLFDIFMVIEKIVCDSVLTRLLNMSVSTAAAGEKWPERGFYFLAHSFFPCGFRCAGQQARVRVLVSHHPSSHYLSLNDTSTALLHVSYTLCIWAASDFSSFLLKRSQHQGVGVRGTHLCLFGPFFFAVVLSLLLPGFCLNIFTRCFRCKNS